KHGHTLIHTYTQTHTQIHTLIHTYTQTQTHTHSHTQLPAGVGSHTHSNKQASPCIHYKLCSMGPYILNCTCAFSVIGFLSSVYFCTLVNVLILAHTNAQINKSIH